MAFGNTSSTLSTVASSYLERKLASLSSNTRYPNKIVTSKYTVLTFLPINFFHQVSKGSTLFFFITLILMCVPNISPFEPYTYILAFSIIVGVSMIKDAMEDYKRHRNDDLINKTITKTVCMVESQNKGPDFTILEKYCMELKQGDFILVEADKEVQADVVVLRGLAYHKNKRVCTNHCFIETSNIDGESNLKKRNAIATPNGYPCCSTRKDELPALEGEVCSCYEYYFKNISEYKLKDTGDSFNEFQCDMNIDGMQTVAEGKNVLLRGSVVKNTLSSLCLVVGVGNQTKQSKSLYKSKKTRTLFDDRMNFILIVVLFLYAFMLIVTAAVGWMFLITNQDVAYLNISVTASSVCKLIFSNYILYTYLIPLSLYVILEVVRFVHAMYISHDPGLMEGDKVSHCRNSNVIEDLGVIDYILTDKTGTITKNSMTLKYVHEKGKENLTLPADMCKSIEAALAVFGAGEPQLSAKTIQAILDGDAPVKNQLLLVLDMLLCNSVEIMNQKPQGISQEEICFLDCLAEHGFMLVDRDDDFVTISILGVKFKFDILCTLWFSSRRQRMDVVVKMFDRYFLLSKGSDQKLLDRHSDEDILKIINSSTDFRCLVMKCKQLSEKESTDLVDKINNGGAQMQSDDTHGDVSRLQRKRKLEEGCFKKLELSAEYLGSTFIEDELQEQVQETMQILKEAGIKIWMITGDKKETAVACAKNSGIVEDDRYIAINGKNAIEMIEEQVEREARRGRRMFAGVFEQIGGRPVERPFSLDGVENTDTISQQQMSTAGMFDMASVVVYRATPAQKGRIAELLVKSGRNTLAIGDGNNDVAMLKDSHVGVGIMGKEGTQAALSADFAIPQFRSLKGLILLHGRYSFLRFTKIALNSYYKNIVFIFVQFLYNLSSGASASPLYNSFTLNYYNLFFTSMIPFTVALFDRDVNPLHATEQPSSYRQIRMRFDGRFVLLNIFYAVFESVLLFFSIRLLTVNDITNGSGILGSYASVSTIFSMIVIYTVVLRQIRQIAYRVLFTDIAIAMTVILNIFSIFAIQELYNKTNYTIYYLLVTPYFYFICISLCTMIYAVDTLFENVNHYLEQKLRLKN